MHIKKYWKKVLTVFALTAFMTGVVGMFDVNSLLYRTSVLEFPAHDDFDGTVYPVKKVPDWVKLSTDKFRAPCSELSSSELADMPFYDPEKLAISVDSLKWGNAEHNKIRNAKITYSVPYMGSYNDVGEYKGAHLAVDIKTCEGSEVLAIANGVVVKVGNQTSGFGKHVVIRHNDVPGYSMPLYSSYSHNSENFVEVGEVVTKGQKIALSGSTGTATTPHVHFQIDTDEAPWHPFWPFTNKESNDAGLSFFESVNAGLGKEKAIAVTVSPMKFVQAHLNGDTKAVTFENTPEVTGYDAVSYVNDDGGEATVEDVVEDVVEEEIVEDDVAEVEEDAVEETPSVSIERKLVFDIEVDKTYAVGEAADFKLSLRDQNGELYDVPFEGEVVVKANDGKASVEGAIVKWSDFNEGNLERELSRLTEGRDRLKVVYEGETYYSEWFDIVDPNSGFKDVPKSHDYYEAIMFLRDKEVVGGYEDGTYQPDRTVSRVEAAKFIVKAAGINLKSFTGDVDDFPFPDVIENGWYLNYVLTLQEHGVIKGNADGTLKPDKTVNKAEFFKMLFIAMDEDVEAATGDDAWYVPYMEKAEDMRLVSKNADPGQDMTRGEVAQAMWVLMK